MAELGDYLLALAGLAAIAASLALAAVALRERLLPEWQGAPARLAEAILALALFTLLAELLGVLGLLTGPAIVAASVAAGAGLVWLGRRPGWAAAASGAVRVAGEQPSSSASEPADRAASAQSRTALLAAAAGVALLVAAQWAVPTLLALDGGIYGGDSLWYHLPFAAHFAQEGSITALQFTDPLYLNWFYPQNAELLHSAGLLLFGNDFLSPLINLGWLGLALLAAWCCGRPYGAGAVSLTAVAILLSADLFFSRQPGNANNDVMALALLLSSAALLLNGARTRGALLVAALAAGLAIGTKLTMLVPIGALTIGVVVIAAKGERLRTAGIWGCGLLAAGGFWYLRNLIVAGNPLPWTKLGIGPVALPRSEELEGRDPFSIVHYATNSRVWDEFFLPGLHERFGDLWPAVLALAAVAVVWLLIRGGRVERMLAAVAAVAALAYVVTPLSASGPDGSPFGFRLNLRYLAPALVLGLALLPALPPLRERPRWQAGLLFGLVAILLISARPLDAFDDGYTLGALLIAAAIVAVPVATVLLARRGAPAPGIAAIGAVAVTFLAVGGWRAQEDYTELRYASDAPAYPGDRHPGDVLNLGLVGAYDWARDVRDARIAIGGTQGALFQYGLYGPDSSNDVQFVGERGARGSFDRIDSCSEWRRALNDGDYDYVVTTPNYDQDNPDAPLPAPERAWTGSDRAATEVSGQGTVRVFRIEGELDPDCEAIAVAAGKGPR